MNARDLITLALSEIRVVGVGFDLGDEDAATGLSVLNRMLQFWSGQELLVPYRTRETFAVTGADHDYTIGDGGDFDTAQPLSIDVAELRLSGMDYPLEIVTEARKFERLSDGVTQGRPTHLYYNPADPLGLLYFYPVPDAAYTLSLTSFKPFTTFTSLDTDEAVPNVYLEPIMTNLSLRLAPFFGKEASQTTKALAIQGLSYLKMKNQANRVPQLRMPAGLARIGSRYNINADE